LTGAVRNPMRN